MQTTIEKTAPTYLVKPIILGKFTGAFGNFQAAAWTDLKLAGFESAIAHKIAQDYGSDLGNAMKNGTDFASKIGKAKASGESRIAISGKGSTQMSNTMALLRVCEVVAGLWREKLVTSYSIEGLTLKKEVATYIEECATWASEQTYE